MADWTFYDGALSTISFTQNNDWQTVTMGEEYAGVTALHLLVSGGSQIAGFKPAAATNGTAGLLYASEFVTVPLNGSRQFMARGTNNLVVVKIWASCTGGTWMTEPVDTGAVMGGAFDGGNGTYTDKNVSASLPSGIIAFVTTQKDRMELYGLRAYSQAANNIEQTRSSEFAHVITGIDPSGGNAGYYKHREVATTAAYLYGGMAANVSWEATPINRTTAFRANGNDYWTAIDGSAPTNAYGAIVQFKCVDNYPNVKFRKVGYSVDEAVAMGVSGSGFFSLVGLDVTNRTFEAKADYVANVELYILGWLLEPAAGPKPWGVQCNKVWGVTVNA